MQECVDLHQKILKPFNSFAGRVLSRLKHSAAPRVLNLIKHCCSFIKHYLIHLYESVSRCKRELDEDEEKEAIDLNIVFQNKFGLNEVNFGHAFLFRRCSAF